MPNEPVNNDNIEKVLGFVGGNPSRAKRIVLKNNGIKQRYYALDPQTRMATHTNAQLTAEAIKRLFVDDKDQKAINSVECIVTGTTTPDQLAPNHGVMVHGELGTDPCEVIATSGICLSGMTALKYAYLAIKSGEHSVAVATGSEVVSPMLTHNNFEAESRLKIEALEARPEIAFEKDFLRWMLSDGAGAFLLTSTPNVSLDQLSLKIEWLEIVSYANEQPACMYIGATKKSSGDLIGWASHSPQEWLGESVLAIKQDVRQLNEKIVPLTFTQTLERLIEKRALVADEIDYFLPHISSMYFYHKVQDAMIEMGFHIPEDKWFTNLTTKGNTGSASIYIMLNELIESGRLKSGNKVLCFIPESGRFSSSFMLLTVL